MYDDPRLAVEASALDAAIEAELDGVMPEVPPAETSVDLPDGGSDLDPGDVNERLSDTVDPAIELTFEDDDYLTMMEAELTRLDSHGLLDGITVITDDPARFETDLKDRASGLYHTQTGELYVAPEEIIGEEPRERQARPGYFSTEKNFGSIWHELGHHRIRHENPDVAFEATEGEDYWGQWTIENFGAELKGWDDWFEAESADPGSKKEARTEARALIESEVSEYAGFGGMEFIAETFAGLMAGHTYSDDIMDLHSRLHGPVPPQAARNPATAFEPMVAPAAASAAAVEGAVVAQLGVGRFVRRLRRMGATVHNVSEIGNNVAVNFDLPGSDPDTIPSGMQFNDGGGVVEATFRMPELQEASQATRGILNRFPDLVDSVGPPDHDSFVNLGFDSPLDAPEVGRDERVIRLRINDPHASNRVRPHVIFKTGPIAPPFDADEVLGFLNEFIDAYEEEFAPFAPREDIAFQGDFGEWPWSRDKAGLKQCEERMAGEVNNQFAFCRAWANEAGIGISESAAIHPQMSDLERDIQQLTTGRGHSYRNFDPGDFASVLDRIDDMDDQVAQAERLREVRGAVNFIEGGRFNDFLEAMSEFFDRLDQDEQELFTKRNPDTVRWMSVWNRANELRAYTEFVELAKDNQGENMRATDPPAFEGIDEPLDTRRRSYRNYAPGEFHEFAHEKGSKFEGRQAMERVESGRFKPMLRAAFQFFVPLDPDEVTLWARRNPGLMEWISVEGWLEDLRFGDQLLNLSKAEFPFVDGAGPRPDEFTVGRVR